MTEPRSYWQQPPERVETVIVGGGLTGVSLLHHLGLGGREAVLIEAGELASGASGRNAGLLLAGLAAGYERAVARHGRVRAGEIWAFSAENHERLAKALAGAEVGHARRGSWTVPDSAAEAESLRAAAELLREDGFEVEWRTDLEPSLSGRPGGLLTPGDGEIDPRQAVQALALRSGGGQGAFGRRIFTGCPVTAIEASAGGVILEAGGREIRAERAVLATNAHTGSLLPDLPIRPVRAQMLATAPTRPVAGRPVYASWGHQYWRQLDSGRLLAGGYRDRAEAEEVGFGLEPTATVQGFLDRHLQMLGVAEARVSHRWAGTMGFTPDELPLVGAVPARPNLFVCGGYTGHGMGFAFNCAARLVDHLLGGPAPPAWLDPGRFSA